MTSDTAIRRIAEKYLAEGYEVIVRPQEAQLPAFAVGLRPDLLAVKADQRVLVEIKETAAELLGDEKSVRAAEIINAQPDWRFDLVVLNDESTTDRLAMQVPEPSLNSIRQRLAYAEQSARAGDQASALVAAWAALEAAMRRAARSAGVPLRHVAPSFLLRTLFANGLLDRSEFARLDTFLRSRNAVVHGLEAPDINGEAALYVTGVARKLLEATAPERASA